MNKIPNRQSICDTLIDAAEQDKDIVVLCSDSRGSASLAPFAEKFQDQFIEVGIAEQNLVSIAAGLASCGKKAFAASPACFLSSRSYEQCKVDCAYSRTNVTLIGISGGISYGSLGMSHHSMNDIAAMTSIPGMRVYIPSDRHQTKKLINALLKDDACSYIRVGRNPVEDIYSEEECPFEFDKATVIRDNGELLLIACGEMVSPTLKAADILFSEYGITASVLDMYCIKPMDCKSISDRLNNIKGVVVVEEHSPYGGLSSQVCKLVSETAPIPVTCITLPDEPVVSGTSKEVFEHYHMTPQGIVKKALELIK